MKSRMIYCYYKKIDTFPLTATYSIIDINQDFV